mmetsp:Transcript_5532/g.4215  ORF Transcript_5532/g.4215 Transcript_5532/m.4215 type:complete len:88 (-) Transcript_5532:706-969(-)
MPELLLKIAKDKVDEFSLHFGGQSLVEGELFNDHIEVELKRVLDISSDLAVEFRRDVERLVGLLNPLDPIVQTLKLGIDKILVRVPT